MELLKVLEFPEVMQVQRVLAPFVDHKDGLTSLELCLYSGTNARIYELIRLLKLPPKPRKYAQVREYQGLAQSMPTSGAFDRVAKKLNSLSSRFQWLEIQWELDVHRNFVNLWGRKFQDRL